MPETSNANGSSVRPKLGIGLPRRDSVEQRLERIEALLEQQAQLLAQTPHVVATASNVFDTHVAQLQERGVDVDERARLALRLTEHATHPEILEALDQLMENPRELTDMLAVLRGAPGTVAMALNIFDGIVARAIEDGLDPELAMMNLLESIKQFMRLMQSEEFQALMRSGVLAPQTLEVVGKLAIALEKTGAEAPGRTSLWGAIRAGGDAGVQRALDFGIRLARRFGDMLDQPKQLSDTE